MANPTAPAAGSPPTQPAAAAKPAPGDKGQQNQGQPAPTAADVRKLKLKLEGKDVELTEAEVIALAQRGTVADKRFQEGAAMRKQAEDVIRFAKENPREFFAKTGMNARQWAEQYLMEELKREQMNPEQKRAFENEEKLKQYEREKKEAESKRLEDEKAAATKQWHDKYSELFISALHKSGLPRTPYTMKRMAELQVVNLKKKLNVDADGLAKLVREDYMAEQKSLFGSMEGDQLMEFLGPELVKKLSKAQIAKLKAKSTPAAAGSSPARASSGEKQLTWREYQKRNRRLP